ncbi:hypothetical protein NQ317_004045 [Molorchus minor]|uniref:Uncharacterized protein n=1 Tax=Molorchus minor TaxID=1323400 RepID=A0ABQ9JV79_9CUCU|nr:hypothetical protein NQ317_004045 [Molorchus minor]
MSNILKIDLSKTNIKRPAAHKFHCWIEHKLPVLKYWRCARAVLQSPVIFQKDLERISVYQAMLNEIVDEELSHPDVQTLLKNESEHFDLLLVEYLHPTLYAFSSGLSVRI